MAHPTGESKDGLTMRWRRGASWAVVCDSTPAQQLR